MGLITTETVPAGEVQLLSVTVTLYVPLIETIVFGILTLCPFPVYPPGPDQLYVPPATGDDTDNVRFLYPLF